MKLKGLVPLVLSFGILIGCASYVTRRSDDGWVRYYETGEQIGMKEYENGNRIYFCKIPIGDTNYRVKGVGFNKDIAEIQADVLLNEILFYGINPLLLDSVDKNNDFDINGRGCSKYCCLRR